MDVKVYTSKFAHPVYMMCMLTSLSANMSDSTFQVTRKPGHLFHANHRLTQGTATWELYYSARETYGPLVPSLAANQPLSPAFWHNLTEVFVANETAFQIYNTFKSRDGAVSSCDAACQNSTICQLRAMRAEDNCVSFRASWLQTW